ncbi:MAG: metallopeptidase TldD-related protein [Thermoanaerobaculia bacterium]
MKQFYVVPFSGLDTVSIARSLAQVADRDGDHVDAYLERCEEITLLPEGQSPGICVREQEGLALRLVRGKSSWIAARDRIDATSFESALRQASRTSPVVFYPLPEMTLRRFPRCVDVPELYAFSELLDRAILGLHAAFPYQLTLVRHRRWSQVIGTQLTAASQREFFYSCVIELPWARYGQVLPEIDEVAAQRLARGVQALFKASTAPPVEPREGPVVLGSSATAVLLHEVVAHALEADTLALGGAVSAARGVELGSKCLNVLDDPSGAPPGIDRAFDDEGEPVLRRWLLREGVVDQPLVDLYHSRGSESLIAGAARRDSRYSSPVPRSTFLEMLPGEESLEDLLKAADGGLYLPEASGGRLHPQSGSFTLDFPYARQIRSGGELGEFSSGCRVEGTVSAILSSIRGIGRSVETAGAGWCAKGGQKFAVFAAAPATQIDSVKVIG